jgi:hypothetical protein
MERHLELGHRAVLPATLIAVLLAGVLGVAAQASAHNFRIEGKELSAGETHKVAESTWTVTFKILGTPFGVAVHIICRKARITNAQIEAGGNSIGSPEFSACEVIKPVGCKLKEPVVSALKGKLVEVSGVLEQEFAAQSGEAITTVSLEGASCSLKEPFEVSGTQTCRLPGISTEAVTHEMECLTSGSKLKVGGKLATFEGTTAGHLEGEPLWSAF